MTTITKTDIENKRQQVRTYFSQYGLKSTRYNQAFDELHELCMKYSAQIYRGMHGFSENHITPFN